MDTLPIPTDPIERVLYYTCNRANIARQAGFAGSAAEYDEFVATIKALRDDRDRLDWLEGGPDYRLSAVLKHLYETRGMQPFIGQLRTAIDVTRKI